MITFPSRILTKPPSVFGHASNPAQEYYYRAYFHRQLGNVEAEMADYGEAIARFPYFTDAYFDRAMTWRYGLGDTEAALADFARVLDIDPGDVFAHLNRADIFAKQGDRRSAEAEYEAAIAIDPVIGYRRRGSYRRANDNPLGALHDYSRAISYAPDDSSSYYFRASIYRRLGNYSRAVADYETIIRIRTNMAQLEQGFPSLRVVYSSLVKLYQEVGDFAAADYYATRLITSNPEDISGYLQRGRLRLTAENYDGAIADYTYIIEYCEARYQTDALNLNRSYGLVRPLLATTYLGRAQAFLELGLYEEALEDANQAIANASDNNPYISQFLFGLRAQIYEALGNDEAARRDRAMLRSWSEETIGVMSLIGRC